MKPSMYEATPRVAALTILCWLSLISAAAIAQISPVLPGDPVWVLEAFTLEHQPAGDAIELVQAALSPRGRVELQGDSNTLVVRDEKDFVAKARTIIASYDHPVLEIAFTVRLVEASMEPGGLDPEIPVRLIRRMQKMLRYESFKERGHAEMVGREGQEIRYRVGDEFRVEFRPGTVLDGRRLKLNDFQVFRIAEDQREKSLIHTRLVIRLGQPLVLGLARSEDSGKALMVVLHTAPIAVSPSLRDNPEPR